MRYSAIATVFGLVATVFGQDASFDPVYSPNAYQEVPVGEPFTIIWSAQPKASVNDRIRIALIGGPEQNTQVPLYTIVAETNNAAGQFVWTPAANEFGKNFYGLVVTNLDKPNQFQYSNPFKLVEGSAPAPIPAPVPTSTETPSTTAIAEEEDPETVSPVPVETTSAAVVAPVATPPAATAAAKPTHVHNNGTAPFTTVSQGAPGSTATGGAATGTLPTGGAVGTTVSLALVGAGALFALAF
jgi:hypothetical protein